MLRSDYALGVRTECIWLDCCEHGDEHSDCVQYGEFSDELYDC